MLGAHTPLRNGYGGRFLNQALFVKICFCIDSLLRGGLVFLSS